jgi:hypothetical protein
MVFHSVKSSFQSSRARAGQLSIIPTFQLRSEAELCSNTSWSEFSVVGIRNRGPDRPLAEELFVPKTVMVHHLLMGS